MICRRCGKDIVGTNKCLYCGYTPQADGAPSSSETSRAYEQDTITDYSSFYETTSEYGESVSETDSTPDFVETFKKENALFKVFNVVGTVVVFAMIGFAIYNAIDCDLFGDWDVLNLLKVIAATMPIYWLTFLDIASDIGMAVCLHKGIQKENPSLNSVMKYLEIDNGTYFLEQDGHLGTTWQSILFKYDPTGKVICIAQYVVQTLRSIVILIFGSQFVNKLVFDITNLRQMSDNGVNIFDNSEEMLKEMFLSQDCITFYALFATVAVAGFVLKKWRKSRQKQFLNNWQNNKEKGGA